jgi:hypothetical protein
MSDPSALPSIRKSNFKYRGIPEPIATVESLQGTVEALKEVIEVMIGQRGESPGKVLNKNDYYLAGLIAASTDKLAEVYANGSLVPIMETEPYLTWDDLRFPATAVNPPGQVSDPSWDTVIPGWRFDAISTEMIHLIGQIPHTWVEGSELHPHIHWMKINTGAGNVQWQLQYAWSSINEVLSAWTTLNATTTVNGTPDTNTQDKQLITAFPAIDATGHGISDSLIMKVSRIGASDSYGSDARLIEFDIHYRRTVFASFTEYK